MDKQLNKVKDQVNKGRQKCPKCGKFFTCDTDNGKGDCWCFYESIGKNAFNKSYTGCLCRSCLIDNGDKDVKV